MPSVQRAIFSGLCCLALVQAAVADPPRLMFPVACEIGQNCVLQNYVDHDTSPDAQDYTCGTLTYDGHNGTDIRIPSVAKQRAGVDVLASAAGRVLRGRGGVPDRSIRDGGEVVVQGTECGNGLVIEHVEGWETQYCHMAQGSVRVRPGDEVKAGQPIGQIGMSGMTEYPHLHFTVRHRGQVVDPFAFGAPRSSCSGGTSLWDPSLKPASAYRAGAVLNVGFATGPVTMEGIESGEAGRITPTRDAPALVAFARVIGLKAGDVQRLVLKDPNGRVIAESLGEPLQRSRAQHMLFGGVRKPASGWAPGEYEATYSLIRDRQTVVDKNFSVDLQ